MLYLPILIYLYGSLVAGKEFIPWKGVLGVHKAAERSGVSLEPLVAAARRRGPAQRQPRWWEQRLGRGGGDLLCPDG